MFFDLWQRVMDELTSSFPDVCINYVHVDAACIHMIERPEIL